MEPGCKNPEWREREGDMNNVTRITEIDISKPAGALVWLRLTDYALVLFCGLWAIGLLLGMVVRFPSADAGTLAFGLIASLILGFAAYTGWRHVGVIDPAVWRTYRVVFPLLVVFCLFIACWPHPARRLLHRIDPLFQVACIGSVALLGWISLIRLRRMNITAMGAPVDQVLFRLAKNAGVTAVRATDIRRINKPRGLVLGAAGALMVLVSFLRGQAFTLISLWGFFLLVRARRYFQIDADSLLAADRRPAILFLRSFDDDTKQKFFGSERAVLDFSLETRLSNHFSRFGPFVAIGSPKEKVPQPGAARVLLSDDEWQPRVLSWMRDARLIIMYSGKTHWVNWELRQVVKNECATRLILMMPEINTLRDSKRNKEISARVEQVREVFNGTPWEEELSCFNDFARLRAMLFRPDGSMVMVKSRSDSRDSYHLAALVAHQILIDSDALNDEDEDVQKAHEIGAGTDHTPPQPVRTARQAAIIKNQRAIPNRNSIRLC
jgi:hypothetical protein